MKTLYLDVFSGISGDMFIGALLDLGVDAEMLERELSKLRLEGYHLHVRRGEKSGIAGTKFDVHLAHDHHHSHEQHEGHAHPHGHSHAHHHDHGTEEHHHGHADHEHNHEHDHDEHHEHTHAHHHHSHEDSRNFLQIQELISQSSLSEWVKHKAIAVFTRIAIAEGKIHGVPPERVHFHEVGAVDSIVDIVGACIAMEMLGKPRVQASTVIEGTGWVRCAHGRFPIPAPATLAILGGAGVALTQCEEPHELVTPTGAALLAEFAEGFGPMRGLVAERIGFGLGTRDNKTRPNVIRAVLGSSLAAASADLETDSITVLETNIDDASAEILGLFLDRAMQTGALDVFYTPIQMKKNRPATMLTVLAPEEKAEALTHLLLTETTAFGVRRYTAERRKLPREFVQVSTTYGTVTIKLGKFRGQVVQAAPEYESVRKLAELCGVPFKEVYAAAVRAYSGT